MSCRRCYLSRGKGEIILEKLYQLERYLHNFFAALVVSYWLTGRTPDSYWSIVAPEPIVSPPPPTPHKSFDIL
jgi:hypothetical protein